MVLVAAIRRKASRTAGAGFGWCEGHAPLRFGPDGFPEASNQGNDGVHTEKDEGGRAHEKDEG